MAIDSGSWRRRTLGRRSALWVGGLAGASAALLAACGGGGKNDKPAQPAGGQQSGSARPLLTATAQAATAKQPKPGGLLTWQLSSPPPTLDPYTQTSFICSYMNSLAYSKLYRFRNGVPEVPPNDFTMEPDLAEKMPEQADPTTLTIKLKAAKFHNVAPLNGREVTSEDVRYAIDRYQNFEKSVHRPLWFFLDKIETPDKQTVVLKLKSPYADAVQVMGGNLAGYISPKELAETTEATSKMVGSGPFIHTEYQSGVSVSFKRNPDYYDKPFPYLDEIKAFVVTDQAKRVADFSARSVDLTWLFLPDERDQLKKNRPDAHSEEIQGIGGYIYMRTDKPPFNDKRVRQALSMAIDRKAIREALTKGEGIEDQAVFVGLNGWARQVKDLPQAKYWQYNPGEAKKLLDAAGVSNPTWTWDHADASVYTQAYVDTVTLTIAQWKSLGITIKDQQAPYAQYISTTYQGQYENFGNSPRSVPYFIDVLGDRFYWGPGGTPKERGRINLSYVNNPQLNQLLDKQRTQMAEAERKATIRQIEELIAEEQWEIYYSTDTRTFFWDTSLTNYRPTAFFPYTHLMKSWKEK